MLFLDRAGAEIVCMAPDVPQRDVVNHLTKEPEAGATRNALAEAARIARGNIRAVGEVKADELDALVMPGGFGAAKTLCDFALSGAGATARDDVAQLMRDVHSQGKPIGAVCIAPALVAAVLGKTVGPGLTIGKDAGTAQALEQMGATHHECAVQEFWADEEHRIASTPAYMFDARMSEVATGIEKLVNQVVTWCAKTGAASR